MGFDLIAQGQQFPNFQIFLFFFSAEAHLDLCGRQKAHSEVLGRLFSPSEGAMTWCLIVSKTSGVVSHPLSNGDSITLLDSSQSFCDTVIHFTFNDFCYWEGGTTRLKHCFRLCGSKCITSYVSDHSNV